MVQENERNLPVLTSLFRLLSQIMDKADKTFRAVIPRATPARKKRSVTAEAAEDEEVIVVDSEEEEEEQEEGDWRPEKKAKKAPAAAKVRSFWVRFCEACVVAG